MISHLDHVFGFSPNNDSEKAIQAMRSAGFNIYPTPVLSNRGTESSFVIMTRSYLELVAVVDEATFSINAASHDFDHRRISRPLSLGFETSNIFRSFESLRRNRGGLLAPQFASIPGNAQTHPEWGFLRPQSLDTPGAPVWVTQYMKRPRSPTKGFCSDNAIYGLGGVYFVSKSAKRACAQWATTFAGAVPTWTLADSGFDLGPQSLRWVDEKQHETMFGDSPDTWSMTNETICAIRLLSNDLTTTRASFSNAGICIITKSERQITTRRDPLTGYAFVVDEWGSPDTFAEGIDRTRYAYE